MWISDPSTTDEMMTNEMKGYAGFVYVITNLKSGKKYIGKKTFWFARKVKGRRVRVESDWKGYYGSSEELLNDVETLRKGIIQERDYKAM